MHTSLSEAMQEIERLRSKVLHLEQELKHKQLPGSNAPCACAQRHSNSATVESHLDTPARWNDNQASKFHDGVYIRTARSANKSWYGKSSLFYFIEQMSSYLRSTCSGIPASNQLLDFNETTLLLDRSPKTTARTPQSQSMQRAPDAGGHHALDGCCLEPMEEEYFLDLYWNSYHTCLFPIVHESDFKEYYRSLYTSGGSARRQSALVDILVALSMQYGISGLPAAKQPSSLQNADATVAGRDYYLRCQRILAYELESPTVSTLQCQLLSAVYLCCGTFQNMADIACSSAVRTAYMLGIHQPFPADMPTKERELRKRLWWSLFIFESKFGMKLGRPFLTFQTHATPGLPNDTLAGAATSGSSFAPLGRDLTWLSFNVEMAKLFLAARAAYHTIFCESSGSQCTSEAEFAHVEQSLDSLYHWAKNVPEPLLLRRKLPGSAFSTEASELDAEGFEPLWLKRQRLILELMYHNLCTNLHRPFISFDSKPSTDVAERLAERCARHAMALTWITHHAVSSTTMLVGWHEVFQWQWNAAMSLVGFILAYPRGELAQDALASLQLCIEVAHVFGASSVVATSAGDILKRLHGSIYASSCQVAKEWNAVGVLASIMTPPTATHAAVGSPFEQGSLLDTIDPTHLQRALDLALDVDQWTDMDSLWPIVGNETQTDVNM